MHDLKGGERKKKEREKTPIMAAQNENFLFYYTAEKTRILD